MVNTNYSIIVGNLIFTCMEYKFPDIEVAFIKKSIYLYAAAVRQLGELSFPTTPYKWLTRKAMFRGSFDKFLMSGLICRIE